MTLLRATVLYNALPSTRQSINSTIPSFLLTTSQILFFPNKQITLSTNDNSHSHRKMIRPSKIVPNQHFSLSLYQPTPTPLTHGISRESSVIRPGPLRSELSYPSDLFPVRPDVSCDIGSLVQSAQSRWSLTSLSLCGSVAGGCNQRCLWQRGRDEEVVNSLEMRERSVESVDSWRLLAQSEPMSQNELCFTPSTSTHENMYQIASY